MHSYQVILKDVRRNTIVELKNAHGPRLAQYLLILNRADGKVFDRLDFQEVVNLPVVRVVLG